MGSHNRRLLSPHSIICYKHSKSATGIFTSSLPSRHEVTSCPYGIHFSNAALHTLITPLRPIPSTAPEYPPTPPIHDREPHTDHHLKHPKPTSYTLRTHHTRRSPSSPNYPDTRSTKLSQPTRVLLHRRLSLSPLSRSPPPNPNPDTHPFLPA